MGRPTKKRAAPRAALDTTDTKARLFETAMRHFAEFGYEATSLRAIQRELDVNPASAHYHFGSKQALYRKVMESFLHDIQADRLNRLEAVLAGKTRGRRRLAALLNAYIAPHMEVVHEPRGAAYGQLMARAVVEAPAPGPNLADILAPVRGRYITALEQLFPDTPKAKLVRAFSFTVILMAVAPFDRAYVALSGASQRSQSTQAWIDAVVEYAAAGIEALCGAPTS